MTQTRRLSARRMRLALAGAACWTAASLVGCGPADDPQARDAAEWVLRQGGTVTLVDGDRKIDHLDELPEENFGLAEIDLNDKPVTDADLERLAGLTNLRSLGLYRTDVTDAGLAQLADLKTLRELELSYTNITGEGLAALHGLTNLRDLYIRGTAVSDEDVESLKQALPNCDVRR